MHIKPLLLSSILLSLAACGDVSTANSQANMAQAPTDSASVAAPRPAANASVDPVASQIDFAALAGRWVVAGVAIGSGPVQALTKDDPAYMGRILEIDADHLAWPGEQQGSSAATLSDRCDGPVTARQSDAAAKEYDTQFATQLTAFRIDAPDPHAVECDSGQWGPEAAGGAILFPAPDGRIAMSWYDGAMLLLEKQGKPAAQ